MKVLLTILCIAALLMPGSVFAVAPTDLPIGSPGWQPIARSFLFQVPFYHQQRSLTCEIAALRMALKGVGVTVSETELWNDLAKDPTPRRVHNGIVTWGDPNTGFVGKPNGSMFRTGFGVYAPPIVALAKRYADASVIRVDDPYAIDAALSKGHPIVYWTVIGNSPSVTTWNTPSGKTIRAPYYEHTRVIVGYRGTTEKIEGVYILDSLTSLSYVPWSEFHNRNTFFDHVGVEIQKKK
jgi:uncharacterized protein YvpB